MDSQDVTAPHSYERENCTHLSDHEWSACNRMAHSVGTKVVASMLHSLTHEEQHASISQFLHSEVEELLRQAAQPTNAGSASFRRPESLKLDVSKYRGETSDPLLRWLVELDSAVAARQIVEPRQQVAFAMSCLAGRAKSWAFGRLMADGECFPNYETFKDELKETFEPPKSEFRSRAEFLDLRQGKRDIHAYAQRARYLAGSIVRDPIDDATQVVTFMKGLVDGPVKTYLFREYPDTLEGAISLAIQEDFSLKQAKLHSSAPRLPKDSRDRRRRDDEPEPMDLSSADAAERKKLLACHRCQKKGHMAYECLAAKPALRQNAGHDRKRSTSSLRSADTSADDEEEESKNDDDQ